MQAVSVGMLIVAARDWRRIYVGRNGVELVGFRSGTSRLRPLWLWLTGHLKYSGRIPLGQYGSPGVYLVLSDKGRKVAENADRFLKRWSASRSL